MMDRRSFLLGGVAVVAVSCSTGEPAALAPPVEDAGPYTLGPGDKVRVTVFGEPTLTGEYTVTGAGAVSFPLIGNVPAAGKTVEDLQQNLRTKLAGGYLDDPRVSAEIIDYRPYYILGEVSRPGQYPFSIGMTIDQAVAAAGGFTYRANPRRVFVKRPMETSEWLVDVRRNPSYPVRPGDTIRVGERFF